MNFLEPLLRLACPHRFTWPRADASGRDYQVCLHCGTAYEYDWDGMRQTGRLQPLASVASSANALVKTNSWSWR